MTTDDESLPALADMTMGHQTFVADLNARLESLRQQGAHLLTPILLQQIPAKHLPVVFPVYIHPDPAKGEVYPQGKRGYGQAAVALFALTRISWQRLEQALGIDWDAKLTGRVDSGANPDYVHYRVVGFLKMPDGTMKQLIGEKEIRVDVVAEEYRDSYRKKVVGYVSEKAEWFLKLYPRPEDQEAYIADKVRQDVLQVKKHLLARAVTGAKSNATKGLGIKEVYTSEELRHPFVVLKLQARLDPNDPQDAALIRLQALGFTEAMYRSQVPDLLRTPPKAELGPPPVISPPIVICDPVPATPNHAPQPDVPEPQPPAHPLPSSAPIPEAKPDVQPPVGHLTEPEFAALSPHDQAQCLRELAESWDRARLRAYTVERMERWKETSRMAYYRDLLKKVPVHA